jgi:hypothetical protein
MKKVSLFILVAIFTVCLVGCDIGYPSEQKQFLNRLSQIRRDYNSAKGNDLSQDKLCKEFDDFVRNFQFNNWEGKVIEVNGFLSSAFGTWVKVQCGDISFLLWPEDEMTWSQIGKDKLENLKIGQTVNFSGTILREISLTCTGKMREPEIKVEPKSIQAR